MPTYSKRRSSSKSILRIVAVAALAIACVVGLMYEELAFKHRQRTTWTTVTATVEQSRLRPIAGYALEYGSKKLYEVDVFASYSMNNVQHKEWVPLSQAPLSLAEAQSMSPRLKGRSCFVRWDPSSPDQRIADLR
jgi:hypothetical protein